MEMFYKERSREHRYDTIEDLDNTIHKVAYVGDNRIRPGYRTPCEMRLRYK